ncbi:uncharacterized protein [Diadema antillarum]|uniref:uncharacterized protein n=1 Tax=Diadema antillarum TaxID=105358 RepID=UPI003A86C709
MCSTETPTVTLVDGPSPLEGLVVFEPDRYVCYDGFNDEAAKLVCGELGFPAVSERHSAEALPRTVSRSRTGRLSCQNRPGGTYQRLKDCQLTTADCSLNGAVRLKCQEPFGEIESEGRNSQNWTCPRQVDHESGQLVHESFNISVGFCVHPGQVPNGHWDSDMTYFGSEITLTCDESYSVNGSATLQCVWLPGRSTYFPTWNVSIPFCWRSETITEGGTTTKPTPTQNADYISSDGGLTFELTTLPEITATSFLSDGNPTENVFIPDASETTTIEHHKKK